MTTRISLAGTVSPRYVELVIRLDKRGNNKKLEKRRLIDIDFNTPRPVSEDLLTKLDYVGLMAGRGKGSAVLTSIGYYRITYEEIQTPTGSKNPTRTVFYERVDNSVVSSPE